MVEFDEIKKAKQYNTHKSGKEPRDFFGAMNGHLSASLKYSIRKGLKPGNSEKKDLLKMAEYLRFMTEDIRDKKLFFLIMPTDELREYVKTDLDNPIFKLIKIFIEKRSYCKQFGDELIKYIEETINEIDKRVKDVSGED